MPLATDLAAVPLAFLVVLGLIGVAEVVLDVVALVDLYRRPVDQLVLPNKWIWVAIILLVNLLGAILYLAIARKPAPAGDQGIRSRPSAGSVDQAVDSLYGPKESSPQP